MFKTCSYIIYSLPPSLFPFFFLFLFLLSLSFVGYCHDRNHHNWWHWIRTRGDFQYFLNQGEWRWQTWWWYCGNCCNSTKWFSIWSVWIWRKDCKLNIWVVVVGSLRLIFHVIFSRKVFSFKKKNKHKKPLHNAWLVILFPRVFWVGYWIRSQSSILCSLIVMRTLTSGNC